MRSDKRIIIICIAIVAALLAALHFIRPTPSRIIGVIVTQGGQASGHIYVNQLADDYDISFFEALGIEDGIAYFIIASDFHNQGGWARTHSVGITIVGNNKDHLASISRRGRPLGVTIDTNLTIYVAPTAYDTVNTLPPVQQRMFNFITIAQDANGRIYPTSGFGVGMGGMGTEGKIQSFTLTDDYTSIGVSLHIRYEPYKIVVAQMDAHNNLLLQREYTSNTDNTSNENNGIIPSIYTPKDAAAYLIIETHTITTTGETRVSRSLHSRDDAEGNFTTFWVQPSGVFERHESQIAW